MRHEPGFSVVRFSPDPEEFEHVGVALLLWGADRSLHYNAEFPRLRCLAGSRFPSAMLEQYLRHVGERSRELDPREIFALNALSAQLRVSPFRPTPQVADPSFVATLEKHYLSAMHDARAVRHRRLPSLERRMDSVLRHVLASQQFLRKPTASELLGPVAFDLYGSERLSVNRAFRGHRGIVLVDALDLDRGRASVEARAGHVSYAFTRFGEARKALHDDGLSLQRVTLMFGATNEGGAKAAVRDWAHGLLSRSSETILDQHQAEAGLETIAHDMGALLGPN